MWSSLRWWTPAKILPHGIAGVVSLGTGAVLVAGAISGRIVGAGNARNLLAYVYLWATLTNAMAGFLISKSAPQNARAMFKVASLLQSSLVYFAFRFLTLPDSDTNWAFLRAFDGVAACGLLAIIVHTAVSSWTQVVKTEGKAIAASITAGSFSLLLLAGYPIQLAIAGPEWFSCVIDNYAEQQTAFVFFVYIPTTWIFSVVLFSVTLLHRRILSKTTFCVLFVGLLVGILCSTVLMQEVHIPWVSTQRLIINCPEAPPGSFQAGISDALDTSRLAQRVLALFRSDTTLL